jgi:hypothetical protein
MLPESVKGLEVQCPHCHQVFRAQSNATQVKPEDPGGYRAHVPVVEEERFRRRLEEDDGRVRGPLAGLGRARAAIIMLIVTLIVEGIGIGVSILYLKELNRLIQFWPGPFPNLAKAQSIENLYSLLGIMQIGVTIGTAIAFLMWIFSAHSNLRILGAEGLQFTPGWAVGYFFIPILNLFRPFQVTQEIWRASDPQASDSWKRGPGSVLAGFWWALWLLSEILAQFSFRMVLNPNSTLQEIRLATTINTASAGIAIFAGILLIFLIKGIMNRQTEKFERLTSQTEFQ